MHVTKHHWRQKPMGDAMRKRSRIETMIIWWERQRLSFFTLLFYIEEGWLLIQLLMLILSGPWSEIQNQIHFRSETAEIHMRSGTEGEQQAGGYDSIRGSAVESVMRK